MLVTPLLSASPLAVPPLAQYDHHHQQYSIENISIDSNIPKNLKALPNIRNWSEKPPDLVVLNQLQHQQPLLPPATGSPILSISTTYNSSEHAKEITWSSTSSDNGPDNLDRLTNIRYHNRTSYNQFTRNYFFNLSATESSAFKLKSSASDIVRQQISSSNSNQFLSNNNKNSNNQHNQYYSNNASVNSSGYNRSLSYNNNNYNHNNYNNNNNNHKNNIHYNNQINKTGSTLNGQSSNIQNSFRRKISEQISASNSSANGNLRKNSASSTSQTNQQLINTGYIDDKNTIFSKYGYFIILVVALSILGVSVLLTLVGLRYFRTTRGTTRALALPLPLLPDDRTPLNAEPEHPVPMLSVQSPGCAGMERLGVPARSSLGSPPMRDERSHLSSRRLRADTQTFQTHHQDDLISRDGTILSERQLSKSADSSLHHSHHYNNHNNSRNIISCPHHVALPDGEWGPDRDLHNRQFCQQSEIPRTYVKAPPNKTVRDVPGQPYLLTSSSCNLSQRSNSDGSSVGGGRGSSIGSSMASTNQQQYHHHHHNHHHHNHHAQQLYYQQSQQHLQQQQQQQQAKNEKSKASFVAKLFFRGGGSGSSSSSSSGSSNQPTAAGATNGSAPSNNHLNNLAATTPQSSTVSLTTPVTGGGGGDTTINYTNFGGSTNSSISLTASPLTTQPMVPNTVVSVPVPSLSPAQHSSSLVTSSSPLTSSLSSSSLTNSSSASPGPSPETNAHFI